MDDARIEAAKQLAEELLTVEFRIPKSFKLFGTTINIEWDNEALNKRQTYGESHYSSSKIVLSHTHGIEALSDHKIKDTFYHEKIHMILDMMSRHDLSNDEGFVDIFAKLLRQSDETATYEDM